MSELYHYGMPRRSGRYPWGSGDEPFQHNGPNIMGRAMKFKAENPNASDREVAQFLNMSTEDYQAIRSAAKDEKYNEDRAKAVIMFNQKQMSKTAIAERLGYSEGTIRNMLKETTTRKEEQLNKNMEALREALKKNPYLDVSDGVAATMGMKESDLHAAYMRMAVNGEIKINNSSFTQLTTGKKTTMRVITDVNVTDRELWENRDKIVPVQGYIENDTRTLRNIKPPVSVDPKRLAVRYAEDGGTDMDGVIQLRRGVPDISLGKAAYAQVRIAVNGTHYLKGMAVYGDNMPPGVDIIFNTNKHKGTPVLGSDKKNSVLKKMKTKPDGSIDEENPFGTTIKEDEAIIRCQTHYTDSKGKEHQSALNIVREEGDWDTWNKNLAHQFLAKQGLPLIKKQLDLTYSEKKAEFEELKSLTNPIIKKHLMSNFAEQCDSDAVFLKASALPRQSTKVILPLPKIAPDQVYAPGYKNGEKVALVRYPHAGTFEIPVLKVNNNDRAGKRVYGDTRDAIGIHPNVAQKLSGADFDGDTVILIPVNNKVKITSTPTLPGLKDFEPKEAYRGWEGMKLMTDTQKQMGMVSNLITDMTLQGAPREHIERAVKHSMVVIDAEKHGLDYKASETINGIAELKRMYQPKDPVTGKGGAASLFSRAKSPVYVNQRSDYFKVDPKTGAKIYKDTGRLKYKYDKETKKYLRDEEGNKIPDGLRQTKTTRMAEAKDARELMSLKRDPKEQLYAQYANNMKAMANQARLEALHTPPQKYSKSAAKAYAKEVASLEQKRLDIEKRKPLERMAGRIAESQMRAALNENPSLTEDKSEYKKLKQQFMNGARNRVGKGKLEIHITDREWEAIQAGAFPSTKAKTILLKADSKEIKERAIPKQSKGLSTSQQIRLEGLLRSGWMTDAKIAEALGISVSTVRKYKNDLNI